VAQLSPVNTGPIRDVVAQYPDSSVLTYEDVELGDYIIWKPVTKRGFNITYRFGPWIPEAGSSLADEQAAVAEALAIWTGSGLVRFAPTGGDGPAIYFVKTRTQAQMGNKFGEAHVPASWWTWLTPPSPSPRWVTTWLVELACDQGTWTLSRELEFVPGEVPGIAAPNWGPNLAGMSLQAAVMHEVGHVLGLRYPTGTTDEGANPDSRNQQWSLMTYVSTRDGATLWLGYSDVLALDNISRWLSFSADCPVDLMVADPRGLVTTRTNSGIPNSQYYESDLIDASNRTHIVAPYSPVAGKGPGSAAPGCGYE
jgi:hypothetical protein